MSSTRANALNRTVVAVLGLLLLAAGGVGLALSQGLFGARRAADPVLPQEVEHYPDGRPWFWWAVAGVLLLVATLSFLWLLAQLRTDRTTRLDRTTDARDGSTRLHASALTDAVRDEVLGITGVTGAAATVHAHRGQHLLLRVDLAGYADIGDVRARLEDEVVAHLRESVGDPLFPVTIELRPAGGRTPQRSVR